MPRIQLELPTLVWSIGLDVRISDINFAGHLAHDRIVSLLHEARARFFRDHGCTELDVEGAGIILTDLAVVYKSEAFFADQVRIEIGAGELDGKGCDLYYRMSHSDNRIICEAKTGLVFMDYSTRALVPIPVRFKKWFSSHAIPSKN